MARAKDGRGEAAGSEPAQGRVPRDAVARAAQPARADRDGRAGARQDRAERPAHRVGSRGHRAAGDAPRAAGRRSARRLAHHARQDHAASRGRRAAARCSSTASRSCGRSSIRSATRSSVQTPETPVWVFGDFARLSQIFSNVLHNAAKYTADGGSIELKVAVDRGSVAVACARQRHRHRRAAPAARLRAVHAGRARARPQPGRVRRRPRRRAAPRGAAPGRGQRDERRTRAGDGGQRAAAVHQRGRAARGRPSDRRRRAQGGKRVLVVDDNADAAESIAVFLRDRRARGQDGRRTPCRRSPCFEVFAPHVAIIDIGLPGMNGYELAASIRANRRCGRRC